MRRPAALMGRQEIALLLAGMGLLGLAAVAEAVNMAYQFNAPEIRLPAGIFRPLARSK